MITQYESPISKVNIKSLYIGNHWELYSDKFEITNSTYTDICVRGIGLESNTDNEFFYIIGNRRYAFYGCFGRYG